MMLVNVLCNIDGPDITRGPREYSVLEGDTIELICGENLHSNPEAAITWISPHGRVISGNSEQYSIVSNSPNVILRIKNVTKGDHSGAWNCSIKVEGKDIYCADSYASLRTIEIQLIVVGMLKNECCPLLDMYF